MHYHQHWCAHSLRPLLRTHVAAASAAAASHTHRCATLQLRACIIQLYGKLFGGASARKPASRFCCAPCAGSGNSPARSMRSSALRARFGSAARSEAAARCACVRTYVCVHTRVSGGRRASRLRSSFVSRGLLHVRRCVCGPASARLGGEGGGGLERTRKQYRVLVKCVGCSSSRCGEMRERREFQSEQRVQTEKPHTHTHTGYLLLYIFVQRVCRRWVNTRCAGVRFERVYGFMLIALTKTNMNRHTHTHI